MKKSLVVFVDDFSDRVFDIGKGNVTLFDYAYLNEGIFAKSSVNNLYINHTITALDSTPGFEEIFNPNEIYNTSPHGLKNTTDNQQLVKKGSELFLGLQIDS